MKALLSPGIQRLSGKMGDWTYRRMYGKQTIMKTPDMSKVKWSEAQKESRRRFKEAIAYAHRAMADPKVRAHYEKIAKKANRQAFRVAVSDFLRGKNLLEEHDARR
jgi:DnaJ-class molecular chaperone